MYYVKDRTYTCKFQPDSLIPNDFQRLVLIVLIIVFYLAFSFVTRDGQYS